MAVTQTEHLAPVGAYNPYNGKEALDIIMKRVYDHLRAHQDFATHLAYTKFDYEFVLKFRGEAIEHTVVKGKGESALRPAEQSFTITGTSLPAPDDGRREAKLFVPVPTVTKAGLVDIPLQAQDGQ